MPRLYRFALLAFGVAHVAHAATGAGETAPADITPIADAPQLSDGRQLSGDRYEKIAWCGVDDWVSIDLDNKVRVPRRFGKVVVKTNRYTSKTKTFARVQVLNRRRFAPVRPPAEDVFPSHVHNAPCNYMDGGGHWLKDIPSGIDDPTNAVFNDLTVRSNGRYVQGRVVSDFPITRGEWRREVWSYVVHDPLDDSRLLCCDLTVEGGRRGPFRPPNE